MNTGQKTMDDFEIGTDEGEQPDIAFVEAEQDAEREAAYEDSAAKLADFQAEQSGTKAGATYKYLPENSPNRQGGLEGARGRARTDQFLAASAAAYAQPITLNLGGRNVDMTLGDVRDAASNRYNHYANRVRELKAQGASSDRVKAAQEKMRDFQHLMDLTDRVARGEMSAAELQRHIDDKKLGDELLEPVQERIAERKKEVGDELAAENAGKDKDDIKEALFGRNRDVDRENNQHNINDAPPEKMDIAELTGADLSKIIPTPGA